jgi:hypothetical protein
MEENFDGGMQENVDEELRIVFTKSRHGREIPKKSYEGE